jgi:hypothetical protein
MNDPDSSNFTAFSLFKRDVELNLGEGKHSCGFRQRTLFIGNTV